MITGPPEKTALPEPILRDDARGLIVDDSTVGGPGHDIDLLRHLAGRARRPRVIVLTNLSDPQYRDASMEAGAELFLDKSTEFEKVAKVVGPIHGRKGW